MKRFGYRVLGDVSSHTDIAAIEGSMHSYGEGVSFSTKNEAVQRAKKNFEMRTSTHGIQKNVQGVEIVKEILDDRGDVIDTLWTGWYGKSWWQNFRLKYLLH